MATGIIQLINTNTKKIYNFVASGFTNLHVDLWRSGKTVWISTFIDKNIPDGTLLCTLDEIHRPQQLSGYPPYIPFYFHNGHALYVYPNGEITYGNTSGTSMWGVIAGMYFTK